MGRVIASRLAADGFDVVVAYGGNVDLAGAMVGEIKERGRRGAAFAAGIADEEAASAVFDAADDRFGRLDVVVHTAGINRPAAVAELDLADFDEIHRVNVRSAFVVNQQAARRVRDGGSIVNVSSSVVRVAPPTLSAYAASKSAVDALTRILANELRGRDITVNAVAPGPTASQRAGDLCQRRTHLTPTEIERGMLLQGKSIVVSGGNTGIGKAIVLAAAGEDADVVAGRSGGCSARVEADVSRTEGLRRAIQTAAENFGRPDVLIPELLKRLHEAIPLGRIARPAEIVGVVVFPASGKPGYVNGTAVTINGALSQRSVGL